MTFWGQKKISKTKADFFTLEELIMHSFQARIVALIWEWLRHTGLGRSVQDIEALLQALNPKRLYELIEKVVDRCRDAGNVISHIALKNS